MTPEQEKIISAFEELAEQTLTETCKQVPNSDIKLMDIQMSVAQLRGTLMTEKKIDTEGVVYLGETDVPYLVGTPFENFKRSDWMHYFIDTFGHYDGGHHKQWVMDQVTRIYYRTPVHVSLARWSDGREEYRVRTGHPTEAYHTYVREFMIGEDGPATYIYDVGVAP